MTTAKPKRRRQHKRQVTMVGNRVLGSEEAAAIRLEMSQRFRASQSRMAKRHDRVKKLPPERRIVEQAMLVVEAALVKALWVLQQSATGDGPIAYAQVNGVDYVADVVDRWGQAVSSGGWLVPSPRPALPAGKEITAAENAQLWLRYLEPLEARVLSVGAMSKRGDAGRRINWEWVTSRLPEMKSTSIRTLQHIYTDALRTIVAELTYAKLR